MSTATGGHTGRAIYSGLTAAGTNQATALPLAGRGDSVQEVTTAAASTGVLLPPIILPMRVEIANQGAHTLSVYPQLGGTIDNGTANAAVTLAAGIAATYEASSLTNWYTVGTTAGAGGGGTVTSITAGSGLSGGTITTSGTIAVGSGVPILQYALASPVTVSGAVANTTTLLGGANSRGSLTIASAALNNYGSSFEIDFAGYGSSAGSSPGNVQLLLKLGGNVVAASTWIPPTAGVTNVGFAGRLVVTVASTGSSGTINSNGYMISYTTSSWYWIEPYMSITNVGTAGVNLTPQTAQTVNLTGTLALDFQVNWAGASGNTITLTQFNCKLLP
jgi:hypothetical protein